jgi:hypothetical protein
MTCELEVEVVAAATADDYEVRVVHSASGWRPTGSMHLDTAALLTASEMLEDTVLASTVTARRTVAFGEQRLRDVGEKLFDALFSDDVEDAYRSSASVAEERGQKLRVVLRLTEPRLAGLPWEAMFDSKTDEYVCLKEPLVRHVEAPHTPDPLTVDPPLRVLGIVASPDSLAALDIEAERSRLNDALQGPIADGRLEVEWLEQATWEAVHDKLLSGTWHIVHFIGHGDYDEQTDQGVIALIGANGKTRRVGADRLADLLDQASPTPRLVVLNSCESGRTGSRDLFSSTAATLVRRGITAVAAMQFTVSDSGATAFARAFYSALASGRSIDEAARSGRIGILGAPDTLEWVTPVLYVRGDATTLFKLQPTTRPRIQPLQQSTPTDHVEAPPTLPAAKSRPWWRRKTVAVAASVFAATAVAIGITVFNREPQPYLGYTLERVEMHAEPYLASQSVGRLPANAPVFIVCTANGDEVEGLRAGGGPPIKTKLWNKVRTADGQYVGFVPDAKVDTGGTDPKRPQC